MEDACTYDIRFKWLLDGKRAPDHNTLARLQEKATGQLLALGITEAASVEILRRIAAAERQKMAVEGIEAVSGTGRRKSGLQKSAEELEAMADKWESYTRHLEIMGPDRNSYAKTDPDATFMRMKDDHM